MPVLAAGDRWSLVRLPPGGPPGPGLLLVSQRHSEPPDPVYWASAELVGTVRRTRGGRADGVEAERFRVYRVERRPGAPTVRLPRPGGPA